LFTDIKHVQKQDENFHEMMQLKQKI